MKIKPIIIGVILFCPIISTFAQDAFDALRYTQSGMNGSARMQGIAGAGSAIGADMSNLSNNPAGLGFFRKSELSITPTFGVPSTSSQYLGNTKTDSKLYFGVPNFGVVFSGAKDDLVGGAWRGGSFGISFNRLNTYQNKFSYEGTNNQTSLLDYLAQNSYGYTLNEVSTTNSGGIGYNSHNEYDGNLALAQISYFTYLINPLYAKGSNNLYTHTGDYYPSLATGDQLRQKETVNTTGGNNQWSFSYGGNVANKFYFGLTLGVATIRYDVKKTYQESVLSTPGVTISEPNSDNTALVQNYYSNFLTNYTFTDNTTVSGSGANITAGFVYKPNDIIRFGASIVSPTKYALKESYSQSINANFANVALGNGDILSNAQDQTGTGNFTFKLTSPWHTSGGLAIFFGKYGFLSIDADYIPYNKLKLYASDYDYKYENQDISDHFKSVVNGKVGAEFRFDIFRARLGFAYYQSPVKKDFDDLNRDQMNFTVGAGVRKNNFYMDAALVHSRYKTGYTPYTLNGLATPSVVTQNSPTSLVLTFGTYFGN